MGIRFYATRGTGEFLAGHGLETSILHWPLEKGEPNVMSHIADGKVDLVINIPKNFQEEEVTNDYLVRRQAVDFGVPLVTNLQLAKRLVETWQGKTVDDLKIKSWEEY
jgi:carbamoyl-phosphate synthase large subunit